MKTLWLNTQCTGFFLSNHVIGLRVVSLHRGILRKRITSTVTSFPQVNTQLFTSQMCVRFFDGFEMRTELSDLKMLVMLGQG